MNNLVTLKTECLAASWFRFRCRDAYFPLKSKIYIQIFQTRYLLSPIKLWVCSSTSNVFFKQQFCCTSTTEKYQLRPKINKIRFRNADLPILVRSNTLKSGESSILIIDISEIVWSSFSRSGTFGFDFCQKYLKFEHSREFYIFIIDLSKISFPQGQMALAPNQPYPGCRWQYIG